MFDPKNNINNMLSSYYFNMYDENQYMNLLYVKNNIAELEYTLTLYQDKNTAMKRYIQQSQINDSEIQQNINSVQRHIDRNNACLDYIVDNINEFQPNVAQFLINKYKQYLVGYNKHLDDLKNNLRNVESFEVFVARNTGNIKQSIKKYKELEKDLELFEQDLNSPEFQKTKTFLNWGD